MSESFTSEDNNPQARGDAGSIQANYFLEGASWAGEDSILTTVNATTGRCKSSSFEDPSMGDRPGAAHIHYHTNITANIVAGDNAYIEQTGGTNIVGAVSLEKAQESKQDSKEIKEKEEKEVPNEDDVIVPGGPYEAGGSSVQRFFRSGSYAQRFRNIVNNQSYNLAVGGITDSFKDQKLHEPEFEANPRMKRLTHFYRGEIAPRTDYVKEPIFSVSEQGDKANFLTPKDLIDLINNRGMRYIAISGQAGSGKTTFMRRLTRDIIVANRLTKGATMRRFFTSIFRKLKFRMVHFLNVRDIEDTRTRMTPRDLLFCRTLPDLGKEEMQYGYEWVINSQEEVIFVFDGLDQAVWNIREGLPKVNHNDKASTAAIMTSILSGHLLPGVQIIVSSREHSLSPLTGRLRPNVIVALMGLDFQDVEKLFNALLSNDEDTNKEYSILDPAIIPICSIPLFLMYCAIIHKIYPAMRPKTMSEVMIQILQIFIRSENAVESYDRRIINGLKLMSFVALLHMRVTFTLSELEEHGVKMTRDFMIKVPGSPTLNQKLFEGDLKLFFCHQTLQEKFAAMYICDMEIEDFRSFAWKELLLPQWSVVRRFVCGLLANTRNLELEFSKLEHRDEKWEIFKETLRHQAENVKDSSDYLELFALLYESQDEDLIQSLVHEIDFVGATFTAASIHAMSSILRCCRHLNLIHLGNCDLNKELFDIFDRTTRDCHLTVDAVMIENITAITFKELKKLLARFESHLLSVTWQGIIDRKRDFPGLAILKVTENDVIGVLVSPPKSLPFTYTSRYDEFLSDVEGISKMIMKPGEVLQQMRQNITEPIVACCHLKNTPIQNEKVQSLDVSGDTKLRLNNGFTAFGHIVSQWDVDEVLMKACDLGRVDMENFKKGFGNAKIRKLDVSENPTLQVNSGYKSFGSAIAHCKTEEVLMRKCKLCGGDMEDFMRGSGNAKIRMLDVSENDTLRGNSGFKTVGSAAKQCEAEEVLMRGCKLRKDDIEGFTRGAGSAKIKKLDVSENRTLREDSGFAAFGSAVQQSHLEEVWMRECELGRNDMEDFMKGAENTKIKILDVSSNDTLRQSSGFAAFGSVVQHCKVEEVTMRSCKLWADHMKDFVKGVGTTKIRRLDLSGNPGMQYNAGFASVGSLVKNCLVDELVMRRFWLTANGLKDFQSTAGNAKIKLLDLSHSTGLAKKIQQEEFKEILHIIQQNKVEFLVMKNCDCDKDDFDSFFKMSIPSAVDFEGYVR